MQATCSNCETLIPGRARKNVRQSCGSIDCIRAISEAHNADVARCRAERAAMPRKPRQRRQPQPLYGDFAQLAQFHGIATDGTGRKVRK